MKKLPANINRLDALSWMYWITEYAVTYENNRFDILLIKELEVVSALYSRGVVNISCHPLSEGHWQLPTPLQWGIIDYTDIINC